MTTYFSHGSVATDLRGGDSLIQTSFTDPLWI